MSHSPAQMAQKAKAMREAEHHEKNSTVTGMSEHRYLKARQDYFEHSADERANIPVPKEMLEREYDKTEGGYTHKRKGTYEE